MGTGADTASTEDPHWKRSHVTLQYDAVDVTDDNNFGTALEDYHQMLLVHTPHPRDL